MTYRVLNAYVSDNKDRKNFSDPVTAKEWAELLSGFPTRARHQAANLAAHNWDVAIVGDRLLISNRWGGGYWWDKGAEKSVRMTAEEDAALQPKKPERFNAPASPNYDALLAALSTE